MEEQKPPVKVGDILEDQEVIGQGKKTDGVLKHEGFIVFVNNSNIGDKVSCRIDKVLPKFAIAIKIC